MKVKQLIDILSLYDENDEVILQNPEDNFFYTLDSNCVYGQTLVRQSDSTSVDVAVISFSEETNDSEL